MESSLEVLVLEVQRSNSSSLFKIKRNEVPNVSIVSEIERNEWTLDVICGVGSNRTAGSGTISWYCIRIRVEGKCHRGFQSERLVGW